MKIKNKSILALALLAGFASAEYIFTPPNLDVSEYISTDTEKTFPSWSSETEGTPNTNVDVGSLFTIISYNGTSLITGHRFNSCGTVLYKHEGLVAERTQIYSNEFACAGSVTTDKNHIYLLSRNSPTTIIKLDFDGNFIENLTFNSGNNDYKQGVAYDGEFFYIGTYSSGLIEKFNKDGNLIDAVLPNSPYRNYIMGLVHTGEQLLVDTDYDKVLIMNPGFSNNVVGTINTPDNSSYDITYDGSNLITTGANRFWIHNGLNQYGQ